MATPSESATDGTPGWCSWHSGPAYVQLITLIERVSAPGTGRYACAECRAGHGLTPAADIPVAAFVEREMAAAGALRTTFDERTAA